jgi:hypothetical protein
VARCTLYLAILIKPQGGILGAAHANGILQNRIEDRLKLAERAGDDAQHVARSGLLFQRLAQFSQQPRILNRDYSLSSEVLHQLDLLVGERADFLAINGDDADKLILFEHWDEENSAPDRLDMATIGESPSK